MPVQTGGVHHISGIGGGPQQSIEFYFRVIGLRLVKRTVNYDDPSTYHLYFGDASGSPGSLLTLFSWPGAGAGHRGSNATQEVALRVPPGSLEYWRDRFNEREVNSTTATRLGREHLEFTDRDGLPMSLVEGESPPLPKPPPGTDPASLLTPVRYFPAPFIPPEHAVTCIDAVTITTTDMAHYASVLASILALSETAADDERMRLTPAGAPPGAARAVELRRVEPASGAVFGRGSYHHVAFEVEDDDALEEARKHVMSAGLAPTKIKERTYFRSVYFAGPGGAVLEIATRGPGFTVDEPLEELGLAFKLPSHLEPDRQFLRSQLPVTASPEYADRYPPRP